MMPKEFVVGINNLWAERWVEIFIYSELRGKHYLKVEDWAMKSFPAPSEAAPIPPAFTMDTGDFVLFANSLVDAASQAGIKIGSVEEWKTKAECLYDALKIERLRVTDVINSALSALEKI